MDDEGPHPGRDPGPDLGHEPGQELGQEMGQGSGPKPGLRPGTVADQAYEALRADILSGGIHPDERLTEMTIADRLGISRTPVREAVRRLILEGFLTRERRAGLRVTTLDPDEVQQIFHIRLMLEGYAARRAAERATPAEAAELTRLAEVMTAHTPPRSEADFSTLSQANTAFHRLVMQAARSPRVAAMVALAVNLGLVLRTYRMYSERDLIRQSRHHHDIAEAIAAREPDWAEAVMAAHVQAAAAVARRAGHGARAAAPARRGPDD